jgi:hypothetical protein
VTGSSKVNNTLARDAGYNRGIRNKKKQHVSASDEECNYCPDSLWDRGAGDGGYYSFSA